MKFYNSIITLLTNIIGVLDRKRPRTSRLLSILRNPILYMLIVGSLSAKEIAIIFKGQAVKFEKTSGTDTLYGQINGKDVIATTKYNDLKNTKHYLGAFRKLKRKLKNQSKKKFVTYHVFEKSKNVLQEIDITL